MILCEWKEFSTDTEIYTQEMFEKLVEDKFDAMLFEKGKDFPSFIWTTNYICIIKKNARMYNDISITKIQRNPVCE